MACRGVDPAEPSAMKVRDKVGDTAFGKARHGLHEHALSSDVKCK